MTEMWGAVPLGQQRNIWGAAPEGAADLLDARPCTALGTAWSSPATGPRFEVFGE
ncbi:hypothetical protein [Streptomyces sp. NPDC058855]|uniref:hypothetical protein n=1 Tax=Streptomyces sp. NPDC058855 TaxID=3346651 RepID=UPI0036B2E053